MNVVQDTNHIGENRAIGAIYFLYKKISLAVVFKDIVHMYDTCIFFEHTLSPHSKFSDRRTRSVGYNICTFIYILYSHILYACVYVCVRNMCDYKRTSMLKVMYCVFSKVKKKTDAVAVRLYLKLFAHICHVN